MLQCPLCFAEIAQGARIYRYCRQHPAAEVIYDGYNDEVFYCESKYCQCNSLVDGGVFLAHEGCGADNPFWDDGPKKLVIEPKIEGRPVAVNRYELEVLRGAAAALPKVKPLWFPRLLFSLDSSRLDSGQFNAVRVMLCGARRVGKSVLAMMAVHERPDLPGTQYSTNYAAVVASGGGSAEEYVKALYALAQLGLREKVQRWLPSTDKAVSHLKAVMFAARPAMPGYWERVRRFGAKAADLLWKQNSNGHPVPYGRAVLFYDYAGERFEPHLAGDLADKIREMDATVVLLAAPDLARFGGALTENNSVTRAEGRLAAVHQMGKRTCLVVTKLDLILNSLDKDAAALQARLQGVALEPGADRAALLKWLTKNPSEDRLRRILDANPGTSVFFVWTENAPQNEMEGYDPAKPPRSLGMTPFIRWCLGKEA